MNSVRVVIFAATTLVLLDNSVADYPQIGKCDSSWFASFQLCPVCRLPLVNKCNLEILQFRLRSILLLAGVPIVIAGAFFAYNGLHTLGFTSVGVAAGSFASAWQSSMGMGFIAKGSLFAIMQSLGTNFMMKMLFGTLTGTTLAYLLSIVQKYAYDFYFCDCAIM